MRMDTSIRERLEIEAKNMDRSASYVALEAIKNHLEAKEAKRKAIKEALLKADKGVFLSEKAFMTWAEKVGTDEEINIPKPDIFLKK